MKKLALLLAFCLLLLLATNTQALMVEPTPLVDPIPDTWREPLSRFLRGLGVDDIEATIGKSRASQFSGSVYDTNPARMIFRIIHRDACSRDEDECMTIIGHLDGSELEADAIFFAGNRMNRGDHAVHMLGVDAAARSVNFMGKKSAVSVVETAEGLIVVPQEAEGAR